MLSNIVSNFIKHKWSELQGKIDKPASILENFDILFLITDRSRQNTSNDTEHLNKMINALDLINKYRSTQLPNTHSFWMHTRYFQKFTIC